MTIFRRHTFKLKLSNFCHIKRWKIKTNKFLFIDCMPSEMCIFDNQCTIFCHNYGYNRGQCRWSQISKLSYGRNCSCNECDEIKCMSYCSKKKLKFSGCMCFNLLIPSGPLIESLMHRSHLNECSDHNNYCQCGLWVSSHISLI